MCFIKYFYKRIFEPMKKIEGNIIDIYNNRIFPGTICIDHGIITDILENSNSYQNFIAPGFIDAHVHIESSMLVPEEFSKHYPPVPGRCRRRETPLLYGS